MLRQRILTAVVVLPFLIATIWFGEPWFTLLIAAAAVLAGIEFYRMASHSMIQPLTYFGLTWILLLTLSHHCPFTATTPFLITSGTVISLIWLLFLSPGKQNFNNWAWTIAGILYIGWMLSYWIALRDLEAGKELVFWAMFTTFASDTFAFFCGRTWGKHHMAQVISPGKTWEGAVGGLLGSIIVSLIFGAAFSLPINCWQIVILGCVISIFAQLGDLVGSLLKRNMAVKDSGKLMPGHGGMLDRIDSLLFTGVIIYYCVSLTTS